MGGIQVGCPSYLSVSQNKDPKDHTSVTTATVKERGDIEISDYVVL